MQGMMQDPKGIDLSLIPPADIQNLAATFLDAVKSFYEDPGNEAKFQAWLRRREEQGKQAV